MFLSELPGNPLACLLTSPLVVRLPSNISSRVPSSTSRRILDRDRESRELDNKYLAKLEPWKSCSPVFCQGPKNNSKEKFIFHLVDIILFLLVWTEGSYNLDWGFLLHSLGLSFLNSWHPPQQSLIVINILGDCRVWIVWSRAGAFELIMLESTGQVVENVAARSINVIQILVIISMMESLWWAKESAWHSYTNGTPLFLGIIVEFLKKPMTRPSLSWTPTPVIIYWL